MALPEISLAQFNKIATGTYNAGQIDFRTDENGTAELVKVNNHVWRTSKNNEERDDFLKARFTPLTRAKVRTILDKFANEGRGFTEASHADISYEDWQAGQATANMSAKAARWRDNVKYGIM